MAKIYKLTGYLIDPNGDWSEDDIVTEIENLDLIHHHIKCDVADIGEFYDEHPLNYNNCGVEECEKYFNSNVCNNKIPPAVKSEVLCKTCIVNSQCDNYESCSDGCPFYKIQTVKGCQCLSIANGSICPYYKHK
jgi:hypothetical protein